MIDTEYLAKLIGNILGGVSALAVVIFAFVAFLKQWGIQGKWLTASAFVSGLVIALLVRYALSPAHTFADWVYTGLFGLMAGLLATGAYKGMSQATGGALLRAQERRLESYMPNEDDDDDPLTDGPIYREL